MACKLCLPEDSHQISFARDLEKHIDKDHFFGPFSFMVNSSFSGQLNIVLNPEPQRSVTGQDVIIYELLYNRGMHGLNAQKINMDDDPEYPILKKPKLIVSHYPDNPADYRYARYYYENGVPIVSHVHCQPEFYEKQNKIEQLRKMLSISTIIVVPHSFLKDKLRGSEKLQVGKEIPIVSISNGANSNIYGLSYPEERSGFRQGLSGLTESDKLVGIVGSLVNENKGIEVIRTMARTVPKNTKLLLQYPAWFGAKNFDDDRRQAESLSEDSDRVIPYGDVGPRYPPRPVRSFDVLCSPSRSEVQPITILEALVSGVPVVATRSTPFLRDLENNKVLSKFVRIVELRSSTENLNKKISKDEATAICKDIWRAINSLEKPTQNQREEIASEARRCGYVDTEMYDRYISLYEKIASGDIVGILDEKWRGAPQVI